MRRSMKRMFTRLAGVTGVLLAAASVASAQATTERRVFADFGAGGQVSTRTFSASSAFTVFNEAGLVATNQATGRGFVLDVNGGYRIGRNITLGVGLWTAHPDGASASAASIPDPLIFNHPTTITLTSADLKQTDVGVNFQIGWRTMIGDRMDLAIVGGPTIIHVKQDLGSIAVTPGTQTGVASVVTESATTAKAGNVGFELGYRMSDRYGIGGFVRYAGGEVDLPSIPNLTVGGVQVGGRMRFWF
jgi:hypothetical protein